MAALDPITKDQWNLTAARHLLNRAGFGIPHEMAVALAALTPEEAVSQLVNYGSDSSAEERPAFLVEPTVRRELIREYKKEGLDEEQIRKRVQALQAEERQAIDRLKGWWYERMYTTQRPLEEKLTLMWHGHFAVSSQKVKSSWATYDMNALLRRHANGNFKALTTAVGQSPAMLDYLDNRKSTKDEPNENWARELMELFTLGQGQYTEHDIKESARAFTGWVCTPKEFLYDPRRHDFGQKTFMGRTGDFDGWNIIDIIFEQPAVSTFITAKMWRFFASESPDPAVIEELARVFHENHYEIKPVLNAMFLSKAFYSDAVMGSQIKSPTQFLVQLCADLGLSDLPRGALVQTGRMLGQDLFYPPNVKGWDGNRAWINANSLLMRYNAPPYLVQATLKKRPAKGKDEMTAEADMKMEAQVDPTNDADMKEQAMMQEAKMMQEEGPALSAEQRMADWRKEAMAQVKEKMKGMRPAERREKLKAFREADNSQKTAMLKELGIEPPADVFKTDPLRIFDAMSYSNGAECIAALEKRILVAPLNNDQRKELLAAVGISDASAALAAKDLNIGARRDLLRLITSVPQYQLC